MGELKEGELIQSLESRILDLPPSCVEFCPEFPSYFVVGTYSLQTESPKSPTEESEDDENVQTSQPNKPQNRNGSIIAFRLANGGVTHLQTLPQPSALLDLRFNLHPGSRDIFAVVSSTATLALFRLSPDDEDQPLKHLQTMDISSMTAGGITPSEASNGKGEILFLSFAWHPTRKDMLAVTTSTGHVYLVHLPSFDSGEWTLATEPVVTHDLEAWCVALSPVPGLSGDDVSTESVRVYSGGDDSTLRFRTVHWDGKGDIEGDLSAVVDRRGHDAGVTAILPLFRQQDGSEVVVTGSYDEKIRLFLMPPAAGRPRLLAEMGLGGGVWRLKLIDLRRGPGEIWEAWILASCMHAGARVVQAWAAEDEMYGFGVLGRFEEHKSMNYGSDFQPRWKGKMPVVSTSFYDKLLCIWEF